MEELNLNREYAVHDMISRLQNRSQVTSETLRRSPKKSFRSRAYAKQARWPSTPVRYRPVPPRRTSTTAETDGLTCSATHGASALI
ncbi:hypothetical protein EVAR_83361_1 [Eumeta japonica]|uniref:Uncharacterized protein n=1 Tax=Eumeta variegata TaxID=151549 RepID=A0A4C1TYC0_EUMVA|nr:hypothetical protein EVAR_83361_1 [Eumeta japonica]